MMEVDKGDMDVDDESDDKDNDGDDLSLLKRQFNAKGLIIRLIKSDEIDDKEICWNWKSKYGELPIIECYHRRCEGVDIPH